LSTYAVEADNPVAENIDLSGPGVRCCVCCCKLLIAGFGAIECPIGAALALGVKAEVLTLIAALFLRSLSTGPSGISE